MPQRVPSADMLIYRTKESHLARVNVSVLPRTSPYAAVISSVVQDGQLGSYYALNLTGGSGTLADSLPGYSLDIGSSAGARDIGTLRVRKAPQVIGALDVMYINEVSKGQVNLLPGQHVTVRVERRPHLKMPRFVGTDPGNVGYNTDYVEYHDYDQLYSNQNEVIKPTVILDRGPHDASYYPLPVVPAGWVDDGETFRTVVLNSSFSYNFTSSISGRSWDVGDGTIISGTSTSTQITATFPVGFRYIALTITSANGASTTLYYPIWVHDADNPPIQNLVDGTREFDGDGWRSVLNFRASDNGLTDAVVPRLSTICVWEDARFGTNLPPSDSYLGFQMGWAARDTTQLRIFNRGLYRYEVWGIAQWANYLKGFEASLIWNDDPSRWHHMDNLTPGDFLWYQIREFTNFHELCNVYLLPDLAFVRAIESKTGSVWQQLKEIGRAFKNGTLRADSANGIWLRHHYSFQDSVSRSGTATLVDLGYNDLPDESVEIQTEYLDQVGHVTGYTSYVGPNPERPTESIDLPLSAEAPGTAFGPAQTHEDAPFQYLVSPYQDNLNKFVGHYYAWRNNPLGEVALQLSGNFDFLEPAWGQPIHLDWAHSNIAGLSFTDKKLLVNRISIRYSTRHGQKEKAITWQCEAVTEGTVGRTIVVPTQRPGTVTPPVTVIPVTPGGVTGPNYWVTDRILILRDDKIRSRTYDFSDPSPTWDDPYDFSADVAGDMLVWKPDATSPKYAGSGAAVNGWLLTDEFIYRVTGAESDSPVFTAQAAIPAGAVYLTLDFSFGAGGPGQFGMISMVLDNTVKYMVTRNGGATWSAVTALGVDYSVTGLAAGILIAPGMQISSKVAGRVWMGAYQSGGARIMQSNNYGQTWSAMSLHGGPNLNQGTAGAIYTPWHDNPNDESWMFWGRNHYGSGDPNVDALWLYRNGTRLTSPNQRGPYHANWAMSSADNNRNYMVFHGSEPAFGTGLFYSTDACESSPTFATFNDADYLFCHVGSTEFFYAWGDNCKIATIDFSGVETSRKGNLTGTDLIVGIAGF